MNHNIRTHVVTKCLACFAKSRTDRLKCSLAQVSELTQLAGASAQFTKSQSKKRRSRGRGERGGEMGVGVGGGGVGVMWGPD